MVSFYFGEKLEYAAAMIATGLVLFLINYFVGRNTTDPEINYYGNPSSGDQRISNHASIAKMLDCLQ